MNAQNLPALVEKMEPEFRKALGGAVPSDRFTRIALTTLKTAPEVAQCDRNSVFKAIMQAAQDGLVIDGKEAALVKHNTKNGPVATYIPMVAGLVKKMRQHPEFANLSHGIIYSAEVESGRFEYVKGDTEELRHNPMMFGDKGDPLGAYAVLTTKDGQRFRAVLTKDQIEKRKNAGRAGDRGPWASWTEEMWIKSALRALYKIAPNSGDVAGVLDQVFDRDEGEPVVDVEPEADVATKPKPRNRAKAAVMEAQAEEDATPGPQPEAEDAEVVPDSEASEGDRYEEEELPV